MSLLKAKEEEIEIPQINMKILSQYIMGKNKKLKTVWTPELRQEYGYVSKPSKKFQNEINYKFLTD